MENIKELLLEELTTLLPDLTRVDNVKNYLTTDKALADLEKIVFKDAAIALGNYSFENELYGNGWDKIRHRVQIIYLIKSTQAIEDSVSNINAIANALRLNDLDEDSLINGKVEISYEFIQLTDKVSYALLEYTITELESRN